MFKFKGNRGITTEEVTTKTETAEEKNLASAKLEFEAMPKWKQDYLRAYFAPANPTPKPAPAPTTAPAKNPFTIKVNGKVVYTGDSGSVEVKSTSRNSSSSITIGGSGGSMIVNSSGISVTIEGDVHGSVDAPMDVKCGNVTGNVDSGMSITCGDVGGNVDAGMSVTCGNVKGSVDAGMNVSSRR